MARTYTILFVILLFSAGWAFNGPAGAVGALIAWGILRTLHRGGEN